MSDSTDWISNQLPAMEAALAALVEQNSFTANREGGNRVVRLLEEIFQMPGLEAERVKSDKYADHLVFRSKGNGQAPIALIGHSDTVFPPGLFEGYRVDGALRRGPGVLDMKGGLVVIAWALKAIASTQGLDSIPPLRLVIVSDEEVGSPEGAPLLRSVISGCQAALVFES
ncbi:MAG TPA: M20/M25/M40 family metallo-hydrolase, partial [Archangium sp.]